MSKDISLANTVAGIELKNPVLAASGTFGYGLLYEKFFDVSLLGGFVTKGLSLKPKAGNPAPRICETPSGMLNAIGLQNIGFDKFADQKLPKLSKTDTSVIVNFFGDTIDEYAQMAERLDDTAGVHGLEMNISCPNVEKGGSAFGKDLKITEKVVRVCRDVTSKPLIIKLTPDVGDIAEFARVCEANGADGISVINTVPGMAIDIRSRKPVLANITGGLSGPAIKPIAMRMVWQCYEAVNIPIFGIGGIASAEDIVEFMLAGASAVQIGTMNFVDPSICAKLIDDLKVLLKELVAFEAYEANVTGGYKELIGAAHRS
ncbi:Dihydroorotate dehydrogenase (NAD(+)), catalytic subunit [hydrothermal vent metagenome]|uniref:Dihydroorotate dehydrogenase (NAD(+)), catalytic subunit n=1 Tax=hydrothermal vent metagenome TaxID=652676 RepID=A0A3B1D493_9ZZZZ